MRIKRTSFMDRKLRLVNKGLQPKATRPARWALTLGWFLVAAGMALAIGTGLFAFAFAIKSVQVLMGMFT